jgi:hypothetical protein
MLHDRTWGKQHRRNNIVEKERILITVRTYPNLSNKYIETVCTGGITDAGEWRRLYPVPLRYLDKRKQYRTFDVVEVEVQPGKDGRPETRRPQLPGLRVVDHLKTWQARRDWIDRTIHPSLAAMQAAGKTLAPVRVRELLEFTAKPCDPEWTPKQQEMLKQEGLFDERHPLEKIPFEFRFGWRDGDGAEHDSMVIAWEFGQTWRQYRARNYPDPIQTMRDKWLTDLCGPEKEVSFFMGNSAEHRTAFMVCGVFGPPKEAQRNGTLW